mgnify:CR=1 FL=1
MKEDLEEIQSEYYPLIPGRQMSQDIDEGRCRRKSMKEGIEEIIIRRSRENIEVIVRGCREGIEE